MGNPYEMGAKRSSDMEIKTPKVWDETLKFIKLRLVWETLKWVQKGARTWK
jgi:hypothetical protein